MLSGKAGDVPKQWDKFVHSLVSALLQLRFGALSEQLFELRVGASHFLWCVPHPLGTAHEQAHSIEVVVTGSVTADVLLRVGEAVVALLQDITRVQFFPPLRTG